MKRYLLFHYDLYYPAGGINDFYMDFDNLDELLSKFKYTDCNVYQVFDTNTNQKWELNCNLFTIEREYEFANEEELIQLFKDVLQ